MKRWRVIGDELPVEVECEPGGYPNRDVDGHTQYRNSHFDTQDEAWDRCRREAEARVSLAARSVIDAESRLAQAHAEAAMAAKFMKAYLDGRDEREREK